MYRIARTGITAAACLATACNVITPDLLGDGGSTTDATAADATDAATTPDAAPIPDLRVYYAFDDDGTSTVDSSGHGYAGTVIGGPAWTAQGRVGGALQLGGGTPASQYVSLPSGILDGVEDFTIATWVNVPSNVVWARIYDIGNGLADPAQRFMFMTIAGAPGGNSVGLHTSSYGGDATNEIILSANGFLPVNVWKHVALTGTGGTRRLFVDGVPAVEVTTALDIPPRVNEPIAANSWIGRSRFTADSGLIGKLDEFRIYDRVLAVAELQDLAWPGSDYSYWRFDEGQGMAGADSSDRAIAGTLSPGSAWTSGRFGQAVDLPGGGGAGPHVALASAPLAGCTTQATVAVWVKLHTLGTGSRIFDFGSGASTFFYVAPSESGVTRVGLNAGGSPVFVSSTAASLPADDAWHHVAVTINDGTVVLYVDGFQLASASGVTVRPSDLAATSENWLGRARTGSASLAGAIDELRVGCRALTADEVKFLSHR